jgi:iron complex transport system substrate-binding protein
MGKTISTFVITALLLSGWGCNFEKGFQSIGPFTVQKQSNATLVSDGIGRKFLLVPRGQKAPEDTGGATVVYTPVKRVIAYSTCDVSFLVGFGILRQVLVGVTKEKNEWTTDLIRQAMDEGKIVYLGDSSQINFELLKSVQPDIVFTWNADIIPVLEDLKIPTVITSTEMAKGLEAQAEYVKFIAPFFNKEKEGDVFVDKFLKAVDQIKAKSSYAKEKPSVIWGDVYAKRVLVEPNNAWVAQLVGLSGGEYELDDVQGASCLEITLERFFLAGKKADIMFTYRSPKTGINTKRQLAVENPMLADIKPMVSGQIYTPREIFYESYHRLDEVMLEIASILQPAVFGPPRYEFFLRLQ